MTLVCGGRCRGLLWCIGLSSGFVHRLHASSGSTAGLSPDKSREVCGRQNFYPPPPSVHWTILLDGVNLNCCRGWAPLTLCLFSRTVGVLSTTGCITVSQPTYLSPTFYDGLHRTLSSDNAVMSFCVSFLVIVKVRKTKLSESLKNKDVY